MNLNPSPALLGRVASLHLHPHSSGEPMQTVEMIEVIFEKGILGDPRYFARRNRLNRSPSRRQISLIEREQVAEHACALAIERIAPSAVRANIETTGANLISLLGQIGEAVLHLMNSVDFPRLGIPAPLKLTLLISAALIGLIVLARKLGWFNVDSASGEAHVRAEPGLGARRGRRIKGVPHGLPAVGGARPAWERSFVPAEVMA